MPNSEMQGSNVMPAQATVSLMAQASASLMALCPLSRRGACELTSYRHHKAKEWLPACMYGVETGSTPCRHRLILRSNKIYS